MKIAMHDVSKGSALLRHATTLISTSSPANWFALLGPCFSFSARAKHHADALRRLGRPDTRRGALSTARTP